MACLRLNGYTLDLDQARLFDLHGQAVELRPQALAVLLELGRRHGELVTKLDLSARVWPGVSVTDDSLVQCVVEIRRALIRELGGNPTASRANDATTWLPSDRRSG